MVKSFMSNLSSVKFKFKEQLHSVSVNLNTLLKNTAYIYKDVQYAVFCSLKQRTRTARDVHVKLACKILLKKQT